MHDKFCRYVWHVLVRRCTFSTLWYVFVLSVRFGTFQYDLTRFGVFGTFWYILVHRDAASEFLGMKLSLEED
jgi:hypothetical protein